MSLSDRPLTQFVYLSAFAERIVTHEHAVQPIRRDMPLDRAPLLVAACSHRERTLRT